MTKNKSFYSWEGEDLILHIWGNAGAKQDMFGKIFDNRLKISVKKAPENGQATEYMRKFLAKNFGVPQKNVELLSGETSPSKSFKILAPKKIPLPLGILP